MRHRLFAAISFAAAFGLVCSAPAVAAWQVTQDVRVTATAAGATDLLGASVALDGDTALLGAPGRSDGVAACGAVLVRGRDSGGVDSWGAVTEISPADCVAGQEFGQAVDVDGDIAVVGAPGDDAVAGNAGAAYVLYRNEGGADNWGEIAKLTAPDGVLDAEFGAAVAVSGDIIIVGAPWDDDEGSRTGAIYLFGRNTGGADNWGLHRKLTASDAAELSDFGAAVAFEGDTIVVGAPADDGEGQNAGAAYILQQNWGGTNQWGEVRKLVASDATMTWGFGNAVAISGDLVVVGSETHDGLGNLAGAAYVFDRHTGGSDTWGELAQLFASDGEAGDYFGSAVGVDGDLVTVGAKGNNDGGAFAGATFLYLRDEGGADNFGEVKQALASDPAWQAYLGTSAAISGPVVVAGALGWGADHEGAAYFFHFECDAGSYGPECTACPGERRTRAGATAPATMASTARAYAPARPAGSEPTATPSPPSSPTPPRSTRSPHTASIRATRSPTAPASTSMV